MYWIKRILKWTGIAAGGILVIAILAVTAVYFVMGSKLSATHDVPAHDLTVPAGREAVDEGQRLAQIRGCSGGCHGREAEGNVMIELFDGTRVVAPDLGRIANRYGAAELERAIRHGVRPDGTSVVRIMPSAMFAGLSDEDLGLILAYLRQQPAGKEDLPKSRFGPVARLMGLIFERRFGELMAAEVIDHGTRAPAKRPVEGVALGRYLAETSCPECHGDDLHGSPDGSTPTLAVVAGYDLGDFEILMRTGKALGGRDLDLMARMAEYRFVRFTDEELAALHEYLQTLAGADAGG